MYFYLIKYQMSIIMARQETPKITDTQFYYATPFAYGGCIIRCDDWDKSEWKESNSYNYITEKYGEVVFNWHEAADGFHIPEDYIEITNEVIECMNDQHNFYLG